MYLVLSLIFHHRMSGGTLLIRALDSATLQPLRQSPTTSPPTILSNFFPASAFEPPNRTLQTSANRPKSAPVFKISSSILLRICRCLWFQKVRRAWPEKSSVKLRDCEFWPNLTTNYQIQRMVTISLNFVEFRWIIDLCSHNRRFSKSTNLKWFPVVSKDCLIAKLVIWPEVSRNLPETSKKDRPQKFEKILWTPLDLLKCSKVFGFPKFQSVPLFEILWCFCLSDQLNFNKMYFYYFLLLCSLFHFTHSDG